MRADSGDTLPAIFNSASYILRGYDNGETIVYGTGGVVDRVRIIDRAETILECSAVAFIHARSAQNNWFHCRIERAGTRPFDKDALLDVGVVFERILGVACFLLRHHPFRFGVQGGSHST